MSASPTPAERLAMKTAWAALNSSASPTSEVVETIVFGLGSAGLLMDPEKAAELDRLRGLANAVSRRDEEILGVLGRVDIRDSAEAWDLGMSVLAHLDGPPVRSSREERDEGLRALITQLTAEVGRLRTVEASAESACDGLRELHRVANGEAESLREERAETNAALHDVQVEREGLLKRVAELETAAPSDAHVSALLPVRDALCACGHTGAEHHHAGTACWAHLPRVRPADMSQPLGPVEICGCKVFAAPAELTVYRAEYSVEGLRLGLYTTEKAAREHCDTLLRRENTGRSWDWATGEDGDLVQFFVSQLSDRPEQTTGYIVTPVTVAAEYDAEADE